MNISVRDNNTVSSVVQLDTCCVRKLIDPVKLSALI